MSVFPKTKPRGFILHHSTPSVNLGNQASHAKRLAPMSWASVHGAGFTFIEIMIVIAIIAIVAAAVLYSVGQARENTRVNGAKTSLKAVLPIIASCADSGGVVNVPVGAETGAKLVCTTTPGTFWPQLSHGYVYAGGSYNSDTCTFQISTDSDVVVSSGQTHFICTCATQVCQ